MKSLTVFCLLISLYSFGQKSNTPDTLHLKNGDKVPVYLISKSNGIITYNHITDRRKKVRKISEQAVQQIIGAPNKSTTTNQDQFVKDQHQYIRVAPFYPEGSISLKALADDGKEFTVLQSNGQELHFKSEITILNFLSSIGWELFSVQENSDPLLIDQFKNISPGRYTAYLYTFRKKSK